MANCSNDIADGRSSDTHIRVNQLLEFLFPRSRNCFWNKATAQWFLATVASFWFLVSRTGFTIGFGKGTASAVPPKAIKTRALAPEGCGGSL
jgi:hypothetical protein